MHLKHLILLRTLTRLKLYFWQRIFNISKSSKSSNKLKSLTMKEVGLSSTIRMLKIWQHQQKNKNIDWNTNIDEL